MNFVGMVGFMRNVAAGLVLFTVAGTPLPGQ